MKLYINIIAFLLVVCFGLSLNAEAPDQVKHEKAKQENRIVVTVGTVELLLKYRVAILKMLYGFLTDEGLVVGKYQYGDQKYSIHTFSLCEKYAQQHNIKQITLTTILQEAKEDFIAKTREFLLSVEELRPVFFDMLQLDIDKKIKFGSFFWFWKVKKDELDMLKESITSFQDLEYLLQAMLDVINTLLSGAPKATAQCYERIDKWQKIKTALATLEDEGFLDETFDTLSFLRFIKYNYLDVLRIGEFTKEQVEIILQEYMLSHNEPTQ